MKKAIWFDMDGTIADLYGNDNWLADIIAEKTEPYSNAKPLLNMQVLARTLNKLQRQGYKIGIISWLSKSGSKQYNARVTEAKRKWLTVHLRSVQFDYIDIVNYGTPKQVNRTGVLFDDEKPNRTAWGEGAYNVDKIMEILKKFENRG